MTKNEKPQGFKFYKVEIKTDFKGREIKVGYFFNGDKIITRSFSTKDGRPTLEYITKNNHKYFKIRYDD